MRTILTTVVLGVAVAGCTVPLRENCESVDGYTVEDAEDFLEAEHVDQYFEGEGDDAVLFATSFFAHRWCDDGLGTCGGDPPVCTCYTEVDEATGDELVNECLLFDEDEGPLEYVTHLAGEL